MIIKKFMFSLSFMFIISIFILGFSSYSLADTMKIKVTSIVSKVEVFPVGDVKGHGIGYMVRDGQGTVEGGEAVTIKAVSASEWFGPQGGRFHTYVLFSFPDKSTITIILAKGSWYPDQEKKALYEQKSEIEIVGGSGRFNGIKGNGTFLGKILKDPKHKAINDFILEYTIQK